MYYGILALETEEGAYQIIDEVDTRAEAEEMAANYLQCAQGHEDEYLCPARFVIHRRGSRGWYTVREVFTV